MQDLLYAVRGNGKFPGGCLVSTRSWPASMDDWLSMRSNDKKKNRTIWLRTVRSNGLSDIDYERWHGTMWRIVNIDQPGKMHRKDNNALVLETRDLLDIVSETDTLPVRTGRDDIPF